MLARIMSYGLNGIDGVVVTVEIDVSNGLPAYETVGLPDAVVRESKERVRAAVKNSGFTYPSSRITVNLAPAEHKKEGSVYDLPIAIGLLMASGQVEANGLEDHIVLGELSLDGSVKRVKGVLPMLIAAREKGYRKAIIPKENSDEAAYVKGMEIFPVMSLLEAKEHVSSENRVQPLTTLGWSGDDLFVSGDFSLIKGQENAKRAAEIAVAGGHHMLLIGPPGSGKTMLARSIPSILPRLTFEEALEITKIHSAMGLNGGTLIRERPFRAPHHNASSVSLIGGGTKALPGEISLAHRGVLFLDEFPEFKKEVLESLRQPLEDGHVTISRANAKCSYPSQFMLIAAMNPCPCGNLGSRTRECQCTPVQVKRYQARVSGPMLDRIDLHVEMSEVGFEDIVQTSHPERAEAIQERVNLARQRQKERYKDEGILSNGQLSTKQIQKFCFLTGDGEQLLKRAFERMKLSARAYHRILKVARTIADLEGKERIAKEHVAEAIQYRSLDQKYWGKNG